MSRLPHEGSSCLDRTLIYIGDTLVLNALVLQLFPWQIPHLHTAALCVCYSREILSLQQHTDAFRVDVVWPSSSKVTDVISSAQANSFFTSWKK